MRALAMTGMVTASWISTILSGSAIRATPPSARMSAGTHSSAITATAPASSAIPACSAVVTSMFTPPFSTSGRPPLTRMVPSSPIAWILAREGAFQLGGRADPELAIRAAKLLFDRFRRDDERLGDLPCLHVPSRQLGDSALARRERLAAGQHDPA